jgi:hypothetical protein
MFCRLWVRAPLIFMVFIVLPASLTLQAPTC